MTLLIPLGPEERCAALVAASERTPDPLDWVGFVAGWLPWVGGLALALGVMLGLAHALRNAERSVQSVAALFLAGGFWVSARALDVAGHSTTAGALVIAGCCASLGAVLLIHASLSDRAMRVAVTVVWGAAAVALASSAAAFLAALALAVALGDEEVIDRNRRSKRVQRRMILVGLALIAAGYGLFGLGAAPLLLLVDPLWIVGLCILFAGSALGWNWRVFEQQSRWLTLGLAAVSTAWGVGAAQGVFAAAGGVALVVWGFACLVEAMPRHAPWSLRLMVTGSAMVALTLPLEAHWPLIVEVVSRGR